MTYISKEIEEMFPDSRKSQEAVQRYKDEVVGPLRVLHANQCKRELLLIEEIARLKDREVSAVLEVLGKQNAGLEKRCEEYKKTLFEMDRVICELRKRL